VYHDGDKEDVVVSELRTLIKNASDAQLKPKAALKPETAECLFRWLLAYYSVQFGFEGDYRESDDDSQDNNNTCLDGYGNTDSGDDEWKPPAVASKRERRPAKRTQRKGKRQKRNKPTVQIRNGKSKSKSKSNGKEKEKLCELREAWEGGGGARYPLICKIKPLRGRRDAVWCQKTATIGGVEHALRLRGCVHDVVQLTSGGFGYIISYRDNEDLSEFLSDCDLERLKAAGAFKWLTSSSSGEAVEDKELDQEARERDEPVRKTTRSPQDRDIYLCDYSASQWPLAPLPSIVRVSDAMKMIPRSKSGTSLLKEEISLYLDDLEVVVQQAIYQFGAEGGTMAIRSNWQQWIGVEKADPRYNFRAVVLLLLSPVMADKILPGLMAELFEQFPDAVSILQDVNGFAQFLAEGKTLGKGRCNMYKVKTGSIIRTTKKLFSQYSGVELADDEEPPNLPEDLDLESYRNADIVSGSTLETLTSCHGIGQKIAKFDCQ
jgi:endonuclease III